MGLGQYMPFEENGPPITMAKKKEEGKILNFTLL